MGYNRSGTRRTQRLKRHKREMERLAAKYAAEETSSGAKPAPAKEAAGKGAGKGE
jgi:hypothetical protein